VIYRIIGAEDRSFWNEAEECWDFTQGALRGANEAGFGGFGDIPYPRISNPRARFWFTEAGWRECGREVLKNAVQSGRSYRLLIAKNPPRSAVVYRDKWQVAVLPVKNQAK
jgi:hypothetical protein